MPLSSRSWGASMRPSTRLLTFAVLALAATAAARPARADTDIIGTVYSGNWSGYAATAPAGATFIDVIGSWTVPTVTGSVGSDTYSSTWIGIDGYNSTTVEQIGTASNYVGGVAVYFPWVEYYPAPSIDLSTYFTISAGDSMSAEVSYEGIVTGSSSTPYLGDHKFILTLIDNTNAANSDYTGYDGINFTYYSDTAPDLSSAEWITEAPGLVINNVTTQATLASYDIVNFTDAAAQLNTGSLVTISGLNYIDVDMIQNGQIVSLTTALTNGGADFSTVHQASVAEPASLGMLAVGGMALLVRRRKC